MGELCGFEVSSTQVSKITAELDGKFEKWRNRPPPEISHLFGDATNYKVRIDGNLRDCATLIAIGIRLVLDVSCALSETEIHWRDFFTHFKQRGFGIPDSATSDAHVGLHASFPDINQKILQKKSRGPRRERLVSRLKGISIGADDPSRQRIAAGCYFEPEKSHTQSPE